MNPFYVTTAIHYVNDLPHIGHIYETIVADIIARYRRAAGDDVRFLTGTDEHGQKIERSAAKQGVEPRELVDRVAGHYRRVWKTLGISNDDFIRTTEKRHHQGVYELIRRIRERNPDDLYAGEHSGWYCSNEEAFFPESQVSEGKCENGHPVEWTTERNYFFRLSNYAQPLLDYYRQHPRFVQPQTRFNEVTSFVESGLRDLSVSRTSVKWGIPFPDHPEHIVYVWMDALTNYISALGFGSDDDALFRKYWPADVQLIGKDIIRFHAVYWPAFLMAAGIPLPKMILSHGWWLRDSVKMSKSLGNVVRPDEIVERFGPDPFRYFLLREMVFGQDADYSDQAFLQRYNSDLANDLGNTLSRALKMSASYFDGKTPPVHCDDNDLERSFGQHTAEYKREMDQFAFQRALDAVWRYLVEINGYIVSREPWKMMKEQGANEALARVIWNTLEALRIIWVMMAPFMPQASRDAFTRLGTPEASVSHDALSWGHLPTGATLGATDAIFPRIDIDEYLGKGTDVEDKSKSENAPEKPSAHSLPPAAPASGPPAESTQAKAPDARKITIDQFFEVDLRVAEILAAERVEKSKKLIKLRVSTGDAERTLVAGIATKYHPEELVGRKVVIVANLQPAKLMGIESNGMVLAASIDGEPSLIAVDPSVPAGTKVK